MNSILYEEQSIETKNKKQQEWWGKHCWMHWNREKTSTNDQNSEDND